MLNRKTGSGPKQEGKFEKKTTKLLREDENKRKRIKIKINNQRGSLYRSHNYIRGAIVYVYIYLLYESGQMCALLLSLYCYENIFINFFLSIDNLLFMFMCPPQKKKKSKFPPT